jgi:hypothetical protein
MWKITGRTYTSIDGVWEVTVSDDNNTFWLWGPSTFCTLSPSDLFSALDQAEEIISYLTLDSVSQDN